MKYLMYHHQLVIYHSLQMLTVFYTLEVKPCPCQKLIIILQNNFIISKMDSIIKLNYRTLIIIIWLRSRILIRKLRLKVVKHKSNNHYVLKLMVTDNKKPLCKTISITELKTSIVLKQDQYQEIPKSCPKPATAKETGPPNFNLKLNQ